MHSIISKIPIGRRIGMFYAVCARGPTILAEYDASANETARSGTTIGAIVIEVLDKVDLQDGERCSYSVHGIDLHVMKKSGVLFLCAASHPALQSNNESTSSSSSSRAISFAFLVDVSERFFQDHGQVAHRALAYECDVSFSPVMEERMRYYNNPKNDAVRRVRDEVSELRQVMVENIDLVLDRGAQLEVLVDKTDDLGNSAVVFKRGTIRMSRQMWWKEKKAMAMLILLLCVLVYAVIASICGVGLSQCFSS